MNVWERGVLQSADSIVNMRFDASTPTSLRFSVGVDGTLSLGRVALNCTRPIVALRIIHNGPNWILDTLSF